MLFLTLSKIKSGKTYLSALLGQGRNYRDTEGLVKVP